MNLGAFGEGLARYRDRDFEKAVHWFEEALKANQADKLSDVYVEPLPQFIADPPPEDWIGVWVMSEK